MTTGTKDNETAFTRPGFIVAGLVVAVILVVAIVMVATSKSGLTASTSTTPDASGATESTQSSSQPSESSDVSDPEKSVCGLEGEVLETARLTRAPEVEGWGYPGRLAYPVSEKYGPAFRAPEDYEYCFQHSPEGALFAANYIVSFEHVSRSGWREYVVSKDAPNRSEIVKAKGKDLKGPESMGLGGFRLQSYDGNSATVELAIWMKTKSKTEYASVAIDLVWEDGDWKILPKNTGDLIRMTKLPGNSDFIPWGE